MRLKAAPSSADVCKIQKNKQDAKAPEVRCNKRPEKGWWPKHVVIIFKFDYEIAYLLKQLYL